MNINELIQQEKEHRAEEKQSGKRRVLKIILPAAALLTAAVVVVIILLFHRPAEYQQREAIHDKQVSKYLTHVIGQDLYNGVQRGEPFALAISEEGINDIVVRLGWPKRVGELSFLVPQVQFEPGRILLQGVVKTDGIELFVRVEGGGFVDEQALLHINVSKVKVGAVSLTTAVKFVTGAIYKNEAARRELEPDDLRAQIMNAILKDEPFEPVLEIEKKRVRIEKLEIKAGEIIIDFVPEE